MRAARTRKRTPPRASLAAGAPAPRRCCAPWRVAGPPCRTSRAAPATVSEQMCDGEGDGRSSGRRTGGASLLSPGPRFVREADVELGLRSRWPLGVGVLGRDFDRTIGELRRPRPADAIARCGRVDYHEPGRHSTGERPRVQADRVRAPVLAVTVQEA